MDKRRFDGIRLGVAVWVLLVLPAPEGQANPIVSSSGSGSAPQTSGVLWYGGDYADGAAINNTLLSEQYGDIVVSSFVVESPAGWHVTGLFSNDVQGYPPAPAPTMPAVWSIRTGSASGDFGPVLASGSADATVTPTGRASEYEIAVSGLSLDLKPGVYFMQVSPISTIQDFYVGASGGQNAVGTAGPIPVLSNDQFIDGQPNIWAFQSVPASMGVIGFAAVPEPSTLAVFALAIIAIGVRPYCARGE